MGRRPVGAGVSGNTINTPLPQHTIKMVQCTNPGCVNPFICKHPLKGKTPPVCSDKAIVHALGLDVPCPVTKVDVFVAVGLVIPDLKPNVVLTLQCTGSPATDYNTGLLNYLGDPIGVYCGQVQSLKIIGDPIKVPLSELHHQPPSDCVPSRHIHHLLTAQIIHSGLPRMVRFQKITLSEYLDSEALPSGAEKLHAPLSLMRP